MMWIDSIQFAGFDQGRDDTPVCGSDIVLSEERVLSIQRNGSDRAFHGIAAHLDTPICQEQAQSNPVFCVVYEGFG